MKKFIITLFIIILFITSTLYIILFTKSGNYLVANYIEKSFNKKQKDFTLKIDNLVIDYDLLILKATLNDYSKIELNAMYSIFNKELIAEYFIDIEDLSIFNDLAKMKLKGDLKIVGDVVHNSDITTIKGISNVAKSETNYELVLKDFKINDIYFDTKNAKIDELLAIVNQPIYTTGVLNLTSKLKSNSSDFFDGVIKVDIKNGKLNNDIIEKEFKTPIKQDILYSLNSQSNLVKNDLNSTIDLLSNLANINIKNLNFNIKESILKSDYNILIPDLSKLKDFTIIPLRGENISLNGNIYKDLKDLKDLKVDGDSKILDGIFKLNLINNDISINLENANSKKLLYMLNQNEFFDSNINLDLKYNILNGNGNFASTLDNGHLVKNNFSKNIEKFANIDITKELYEIGTVKGEILIDKVISNIYLKSSKSIIESKSSILDFKNKKIDSKFDINLNGNKFVIFLEDDINNPNIKIDIKNLLIESIKKSKESDKIERKIEELLNKNGIENSKDLKNTIKSLF
ncbi:hypothetical protein CRU94_05565 [Arcobacter sp. AHV-9/2010]|uniref:hypothetical protein n=1 Tax=Arcobacter sp. AHV-9/2010 TaxID=2021861 RepID=UPI00100C2949|nr:hypothetical protein [Arcobacter sp. CECT 9299]RXJ96076.1 hypothetical protein CRU94_05565 [Arcobacter sp. CECT 9299]